MTDEAAGSPGPATTGAGPSKDEPAPPTPAPPTPAPPIGEPIADDHGAPPPPPGAAPPPGAGAPPPNAPPWFGTDDAGIHFSREHLVRPTQGRYVAGVCAAVGRATNTDPVLWRVVIAVLGFIGGIGILLYLVGWLAIPGEGDSGSPLESLLGRGRSQMSPVSVLLLGLAAALTFAFIVNDGLRAVLLGGAMLGGAVLVMRRNNAARTAGAPASEAPTATFPAPAYAAAAPTSEQPAAARSAPTAAPADEPVTAPPLFAPDAGPIVPPAPAFAPPPPGAGYRPPFAPHGPWAPQQPGPLGTHGGYRPPRPPKPPRERSRLGRITFFLIPVAIGLVVLVDLNGATVPMSAYFAAALATVAAGLLVGAWFGRARGLIALAVLATIGLAASSAGERWGAPLRDTEWRPMDISAVADRYETPVGDATLDLRAVDFTGLQQTTTVQMGGGRLVVMLPQRVDTVAVVDVDHGRVRMFGQEWSGTELSRREVSDLGRDGKGGGELRLNLKLSAGDVEVTR